MVQILGSPRVEGDEEEDDIDDLEHEFDYGDIDALGPQQYFGAVPSTRGGLASSSGHDSSTQHLDIPLLTYGEEVIGLSVNSLVVVTLCSYGKM